MINHVEPYYGKDELTAMIKYLKSGGYMTEHKVTEEFEVRLAEYLEVPHVSLVPNGTSALYLSLLAAGISRYDEVIVPDFTMIATANAVVMAGGKPVLSEVEENQCLDLMEVKINKGFTKAMIYVDLNGRSGNMDEVIKFCLKNNLVLIEDACQALGSEHKGRKLGTFGRFGCFSLGFHKIITTGQGGFIVTHTDEDYEAIERLKDFGRITGGSDIHDHLGFNFKFTDLQATIGIEQLKTIEWRIEKKREIYEWYHGEEVPDGYTPWFMEYWGDDRDEVYEHLLKNEIQSRKLYPPIHTQKIYPNSGKFDVAEIISDQGLWLPSSLSLQKRQVALIKEKIREVNPYANF